MTIKYWSVFVLFLIYPLLTLGAETLNDSIANNERLGSFILTNDTAASVQSNKRTKKKGKNAVDRMLRKLSSTDTSYIKPCMYNFTAMLQNTNSMQQYIFRGKDADGNKQSLSFNSKPTLKIGPYFGWRWIFFGYTFNMNNLSHTMSKNPEFNLSIYSSKIGIDLIYQRNKNDFKLNSFTGFDKSIHKSDYEGRTFEGLKSSIMGLNVYYIFNHRRFSYPAAFSQTTEQRKSAGSWKIGFQYTHQSIRFDHKKLPEALTSTEDGKMGIIDQLQFRKVNYFDYSLSCGYAYNWVFLPHFLLCGSLSPAIGYKHTKGEVPEKKFSYYFSNLNFDVITRIGLVWNNSKFFAGSSFVMHTYTYEKERFSVTNWLGYLNIYAGLYFNKRKQYKRQK